MVKFRYSLGNSKNLLINQTIKPRFKQYLQIFNIHLLVVKQTTTFEAVTNANMISKYIGHMNIT